MSIKLVWKNPSKDLEVYYPIGYLPQPRLVYDREAEQREAEKMKLLEERRAEFKARVRRRIEAGLLKAPEYEEAYRKRGGHWEKVCIYGNEPPRRGRPRGSKNKTRA
jgi:Asp-tRNA(Asn)/Glu-tRNA(Gln) amidotransferase A subunit family amidase